MFILYTERRMGRVDGIQDSIRKDNILDLDVIGTGSNTTGTAIDSRIITLVANENILINQLVGISDGKAVLADYASIRAIGVATNNVLTGANVKIQINGLVNIPNNTSNIYYLGATGSVRPYNYVVGKNLQRIATKISDTQILLDFSDFILME